MALKLFQLYIAIIFAYILVFGYFYFSQETATEHLQENISLEGKIFTPNFAESESRPSSIILWTSWRSGSSFLGDLLARAVPNTFYR